MASDSLKVIRKVHRRVEEAAEALRSALDELDDIDRDDLQVLLTDDLEELEETSRMLEVELDPDEDLAAELP